MNESSRFVSHANLRVSQNGFIQIQTHTLSSDPSLEEEETFHIKHIKTEDKFILPFS